MRYTIILLLALTLTGCQAALFTSMALLKGTDSPPRYDILLKGDKRVAVVPRSAVSNMFELQNAPREIARHLNIQLEEKVRNKKLRVVEQSKVEAWLDACNNNFQSFAEAGKHSSIQADIVVGFDIVGFQIRDPQNPDLVQGKCQVQVQAIEVATGKILTSDDLIIIDPPNMPLSGGQSMESQFRQQFSQVIAQRIGTLFHHYDSHKLMRMDADNLEMHRLN